MKFITMFFISTCRTLIYRYILWLGTSHMSPSTGNSANANYERSCYKRQLWVSNPDRYSKAYRICVLSQIISIYSAVSLFENRILLFHLLSRCFGGFLDCFSEQSKKYSNIVSVGGYKCKHLFTFLQSNLKIEI